MARSRLLWLLIGLVAGAIGAIALDYWAGLPSNLWDFNLTEDGDAGSACCRSGYGACRGAPAGDPVSAAGHSGVWPATAQEATIENAMLYRKAVDRGYRG